CGRDRRGQRAGNESADRSGGGRGGQRLPPEPPTDAEGGSAARSRPALQRAAPRRTDRSIPKLRFGIEELRGARRKRVRRIHTIIPAPTVVWVVSSTRMKLPVVRLRRYSSKNSGWVVRRVTRPI